jgi:hypothetical protein
MIGANRKEGSHETVGSMLRNNPQSYFIKNIDRDTTWSQDNGMLHLITIRSAITETFFGIWIFENKKMIRLKSEIN